jgi:hypothetical protein
VLAYSIGNEAIFNTKAPNIKVHLVGLSTIFYIFGGT